MSEFGYKAFEKDLSCKGFKYKIGEIFTMMVEPILCEQGFHYCRNLLDVFNSPKAISYALTAA